MTIGAKILAVLAALCFLIWGIALALGVQPLVPAAELEVLYGEHEDFHADGAAYRKLRNKTVFIVHLPHAGSGRQWWTVDFRDLTIADTQPPRSLSGWYYVMKGDLRGSVINADGTAGSWLWQFDGDRAAFARRSFTCLVRKTGAY